MNAVNNVARRMLNLQRKQTLPWHRNKIYCQPIDILVTNQTTFPIKHFLKELYVAAMLAKYELF